MRRTNEERRHLLALVRAAGTNDAEGVSALLSEESVYDRLELLGYSLKLSWTLLEMMSDGYPDELAQFLFTKLFEEDDHNGDREDTGEDTGE